MSQLSKREIYDLDINIEQLKNNHPLSEIQVKILCEKVYIYIFFFDYFNIGKRNFQKRIKSY